MKQLFNSTSSSVPESVAIGKTNCLESFQGEWRAEWRRLPSQPGNYYMPVLSGPTRERHTYFHA